MRELKIGFLQQHNTADTKDNLLRLAEGISDLAKRGAQLIVLQELHNSLYFCQTEDVNNFDLAEPIPGPSTRFFGELAKQYYEKFYFTPGDLGFHPIQTSVGNLGVMVCWDQWYPEAARLMALQGAEMLIYPTAIGYESSDTQEEQQRQRIAWQTVQRGHAVANGLPVITVNRVGHEPDPSDQTNGIQFWGTSFVAGPQGELIYEASTDEEESIIVELDIEHSEQVRRWWPFLRDRRTDEYQDILRRYID